MLAGALVFVDIDTQRDFLEPGAPLYIDGSRVILPRLARLTKFALDKKIPILATACAHEPCDSEFELFPPHCLVGSKGQLRIAETTVAETRKFEPGFVCNGPLPPHLTLEKQHIDVFEQPEVERLIEWYNRDSPTFVIYGVATDYCVKNAVLGFQKRRCRTALVVDAVRAISHVDETDLLTELASRGTLLTLTEIVCET